MYRHQSKSRLIQLPNGTWIRPDRINAVEVGELLPPEPLYGRKEAIPNRVIIRTDDNSYLVGCTTLEVANQLRDYIASLTVGSHKTLRIKNTGNYFDV